MPRWMIERQATNLDREQLLIIEVYAPGENKELVKAENKQWSYNKEIITQD